MHNAIRIILIIGIFLVLVLIGRSEYASFIGFFCGLILAFIPTFALLALTLLVAAFALMVLRRNKLVFVPLVALGSLQMTILLLWIGGLTAASLYFEHQGTKEPRCE